MASINDLELAIGFDTDIQPSNHKRVSIMKDHSIVIQTDSNDVTVSGYIFFIHITPAQKTSLDSFYSTNEDVSFTFTNPHDGETWTLYFTAPLIYRREEREATEMYVCTAHVVGS